MTLPDPQPCLMFQSGSSDLRLNKTAFVAMGSPERVTSTFQDGVLTVVADDNGTTLQMGNGTFGSRGAAKKAIASGFRKDRRYIGTIIHNGLEFTANEWKDY